MIWGHDRVWESEVIRRLKNGGPAPQIAFDYAPLPYLWSAPPLHTGENYWTDEAVARRKEADIREAERKLLRKGINVAQARAAENLKKIREAKQAQEAAMAEMQRVYEARRAERVRQRKEDDAAWEKARPTMRAPGESRVAAYLRSFEENRIMASKWICTICNGKSVIERHMEGDEKGYQITCQSCGKSAWGSHSSLLKVITR